jgi:hypothetical protein
VGEEISSVGAQVGHLQCSLAQEEIVVDEAIPSQHSDYFPCDCSIHIGSSNILYNKAASSVQQL